MTISTSTRTCAPIYRPLIERIRREIEDGKLKPGQWIGSEYALANKSGLSRNSVRRAIGRLVSDGAVERRPGKGIYVRELHVATRQVELIMPDMANDLCVQIARGAQGLGRDRGAKVYVYDAHGSVDLDIEVVESLPKSFADGTIIFPLGHPRFAEAIYKLKVAEYPFVLVDKHLADIKVPSVVSDNYSGGYMVGKELTGLGHRRVGFIGYFAEQPTHARLEGLRDAICDSGLSFDRSLVMGLEVESLGDWSEEIARCTRRLMEQADRPTALCYGCDSVAAHGYRTLKAMGLRIPGDVSVVGFDDDPICEHLEPPLATVRQPSREIGRVAMDVLLKRIDNLSSEAVHKTLPVKWVPRASVGEASV